MKTLFLTLILAGGLLNSLPLAAQVPQSLNYQGRVAVNGAAFTGTGQFRFALVDGAGTALWSSHASATANVAVSGGLYTVRLGDTSLTNMAAVPSALFSNGDLRLRVWFNDGVNGLQQLAPDQRLAPVGYAHRAASVDSVPASAIAPGFIQPSQMATAWQAGYYDDEYNSVPATGGPVTITFPNPFESPPAVELGDGTTALNVTTTGFTINVPPRDIVVDDGSPATSNVGRWRDAILVGGLPAIAYTDETNGDLKYVRATSADGSTWGTPVTVVEGGSAIVGAWCSMAMVESNPAIAYYDETNKDLKFVRAANAEGTAWSAPVTVASHATNDYGKGCILKTFVVTGLTRRPVIAYLDATIGTVRVTVANNATGTGWGTPQTPSPGLAGLTDPAAFDFHEKPDGLPLVAYYDQVTHALATVTSPGLLSGTWNPVDTMGGGMTATQVDIYNLQDDGQNVAIMWEEASGVFSSRYVPGANTGRDAICESSRPHSKPVEGSLPAIVSGANGVLNLSVASTAYGAAWKEPQRMVADSGSSFERPAAVRLAGGSVLAVFHSTHGGGQVRVSGTTALATITYEARLAAPVVATSVVPGSITRESLAPDIFWSGKAYGSGSFAVGGDALGQGSFASGSRTTAGGYNSTAMGYNSRAGGNYSVAIGNGAVADGYAAVSLGSGTMASGWASTALGSSTSATGFYSTAMGQNSTASGFHSLAAGYYAEAAGNVAFSLGHHTNAESLGEISLGIYPTLQSGSATTRLSTDRLFEIGNGTVTGSRSNAITILKDARTGFGAMDTDAEITHALTLPNSGIAGSGQARAQAWTTYSDSRIKTEQRPITYGLKEIMRLQPRAYTQHSGCVEHGTFKCADENGGRTATIGFIAQEVEQVIPEAVQKPDDPANQLYGMSYEKLIPVMVRAAQELKAENDTLKAGNTTLQKQLNATNSALGALQQRLDRLERTTRKR